MKQVKAFGPGDLRVVDVEIPQPRADQVQIRVRASGICGSDKWYWYVKEPTESIAGHEIAGEVTQVGEAVTALKVGDRVIVNNVGGCGHCPACLEGAFVLCEKWDGSGDINHGYSEYVVATARNCQKLDERISFVEGALLMDNWGTPYGGLSHVDAHPGDVIVVFGLGPIGQAAVALAATRGARIVAVDPVAFRRDFAKKLGAALTLEPGARAATEIVRFADGIGAHAVIECSSQAQSYETGLRALRVGGTLVTIGEHAEYLLKPSDALLRRSLRIQGSWYSTLRQGEELQRMTVDGRIRPKAILTHEIQGLDELPRMFPDIIACRDGLIKAVIVMED